MAARSRGRTAGRPASARKRPAAPPDGEGLRPDPDQLRGPACPECGSPRVTGISMRLTDGSDVSLRSCQVCEHRSWTAPDGVLHLDGVLTRARKQV